MPVRDFAMILPTLAENRKLEKLNLSANTMVDANCDAYDLFPLEELNENYMGTAAKKVKPKDKKAKEVAPPSPVKKKDEGLGAKKVKKKKPIKRRTLEKINEEYVVEFLKRFMTENQNLMLLDLSFTGMGEWEIFELVRLLKEE